MNPASWARRTLGVVALAALLAPGAAFAQVPKYALGVRGTYTPEGMRIDAVAPSSPAERIGLQRGDVIYKINGLTVLSQQEFAGAIDGSQGSAVLVVRKANSPRPVPLIADLIGNAASRWTHGPYMLGIIGAFTPQGMRIGHVVPGTPAERAGLKAGDAVMAINGRPVSGQNELFMVLNSSGGKASLLVRRANGRGDRVDVDLAQHTLGAVGEFTRDGLLVGVVAPGTPAERHGLQRGDLIARVEGQMVRSQTELDAVLANSGGHATLHVRKAPNGAPQRLLVDLTNNPLGAWCEPTPDGMRVTTVAPGTPAERGGLERGDLILRVDDRPVRSQAELSAALFNSGGFVALAVRKASTGRVARLDMDLAR